MNNCDITLWVERLAMLTSDQRLNERNLCKVQRKDFPEKISGKILHLDAH